MFKYLLKFKEPIFYIIVPLIICLILFEIIMIIYKKKTTTQSYEFKKAYFGNLIYLTFSAMMLSCLFGYFICVFKYIIVSGADKSEFGLIAMSLGLVILSFAFFLFLLKKFFYVLDNEDSYYGVKNEK